jgi:hypothetical protein
MNYIILGIVPLTSLYIVVKLDLIFTFYGKKLMEGKKYSTLNRELSCFYFF